jgi:hypothetical protein
MPESPDHAQEGCFEMIIRDEGTYAGVRALTYFNDPEVKRNGIAFWVRGRGVTLTSDCYNSCVGLVLHGDIQGYGAVVHFWDPSGLADARIIVDRYMRWLLRETGGYCGDDVEALVFGGKALKTPTGDEKTTPRMQAISAYLEQRWDMRVVVVDVGYEKVSLDLTATGPIEQLVTLENVKVSSKPHETTMSPVSKTRRRSPSPVSKTRKSSVSPDGKVHKRSPSNG